MEPLIFFLAMVVAFYYVYLLTGIAEDFDELEEWEIPTDYQPDQKVSVVIPYRNEAHNLPRLIQSLEAQAFPKDKVEFLLVDDHSEDQGTEIVASSEFVLLSLKDTYGKKAALELGIEYASGAIILCTDADVELASTWVSSIASFFEKNKVDFTTGLVSTSYRDRYLLDAFQYLDFAAMMQVTASGIKKKTYYIANGANMAFRKDAFLSVGGFSEHRSIASGDDMFLIHALSQDNGKEIKFLKSRASLVTTQALPSLGGLLRQRHRWAAKTSHFAGSRQVQLQMIIAGIHLIILVYFILSIWLGGLVFFAGLFLLFIKWIMDFLFLSRMCDYYDYRKPLKYFIPGAAMYFLIILASAYYAVFKPEYRWKGRKLKD